MLMLHSLVYHIKCDVFLFLFFVLLPFLGRHMEVPRPGLESEL